MNHPTPSIQAAMAARRHGFALLATLMVVAAIALLGVALFTVLRYELATVGSHDRQFRALLAVESGLNESAAQIEEFLRRTEVGGAAFTTWSYQDANRSSFLALTAGRPDLTQPATPWLDSTNTRWLGTVDDPDAVLAAHAANDPAVVDMNAKGRIAADKRPLPVRWREMTNGTTTTDSLLTTRFAVWVDDETSRLDLGSIAGAERLAGESAAEIPLPGSTNLIPPDTNRRYWLTSPTARELLALLPGFAGVLDANDDFLTTAHGINYRVVQWAPEQSGDNTAKHPARGMARRNLNWQGWLDDATPIDQRVNLLAEWMQFGAPDFYRYGAPSFWPSTSSNALPNFTTPLADVTPHQFVRDNQLRTIAASMLDYLDADITPTQPAWLAARAVHLPTPNETDRLMIQEFALPEYFGADRAPRINEMQIIWNSTGAADGYKARTNVQRTAVGAGIWEYEIPVTWRFELWNMDKHELPAASYAIRTFFMQQIRSSTFGAIGSLPIPETSEPVMLLNNGNPVAFAASEVKTFDITVTYRRRSIVDRGTTWSSFRLGATGTADDEPDGHQRQAHVLVDPATGAWYHATTYKQMIEAPTDGLCSAGIGSAGPSQGNRVNDPRIEPLRSYLLDSTAGASMTNYDGERDGASNTPGGIGRINNQTGSKNFHYQNLARWIDRPKFTSIIAPLEGVTRVGNTAASSGGPAGEEAGRFFSVGELGRIFDPGWTHPGGRGNDDAASNTLAYHRGCRSPFHGGGTLRIGQPDGLRQLAANSWNLTDLFDTDPGAKGELDEDEFTSLATRGRVNLNTPRSHGTDPSVLESLLTLEQLNDGAPGESGIAADAALLAKKVEARLTKQGADGVGGMITSWKQCRPFFSVGELSELPFWRDPALYRNAVATADTPAGLNRSDAGREEIFARSAALLTTQSHCFRIVVAGSVGRTTSTGGFIEVARRTRQFTVLFEPDFDPANGRLKAIHRRILAARDL